MNLIKTFTFILLLFDCSISFGQTVVNVTYYSGTLQSFSVAESGKLYFDADNLLIKLDGTTAPTTIPVNIVQKITFSKNTPPLAVDLFQFNVLDSRCAATVNWSSETENNLNHYELWYGKESNKFDHVLKVDSKGSYQHYAVNLNNLTGKYFFQLKMIDNDQSISYSNIISNQISCTGNSYTLIYPNNNIIRILSEENNELKTKIFTLSGQLMHQGIYEPNQDINISDLAAGLYLMQVNGVTLKFPKI